MICFAEFIKFIFLLDLLSCVLDISGVCASEFLDEVVK